MSHALVGDFSSTATREVKRSKVAQSCPTLCNPMGCSLSGSSVHGVFPTRTVEWVTISFSRGSSQPRDWTRVSCIAGRDALPSEPPGKPSDCFYAEFDPFLIFSQGKKNQTLKRIKCFNVYETHLGRLAKRQIFQCNNQRFWFSRWSQTILKEVPT